MSTGTEATTLPWILFTDGASDKTTDRAGIGIALYRPGQTDTPITVSERLPYSTSHIVEYKAILRGLQEAYSQGVSHLEIRSDTKTLVGQLDGTCKVRAAQIVPLVAEAKALISRFSEVKATYIPREQNGIANKLARSAIQGVSVPPAPKKPVVAKPVSVKPIAVKQVVTPTASTVIANPPQKHQEPIAVPEKYWRPVGKELWTWNLSRLWQAAKDQPVILTPLSEFDGVLDTTGWFGDEPLTIRRLAEMARLVAAADVDKPLLIAEDGSLLDGRFRLARAYQDGRTTIGVVRLRTLPKPDARLPLWHCP